MGGPRWPGTACTPPVDRSGQAGVDQVEVVLPGRAVVADLPRTLDCGAVRAEGADVTLGEVERREVLAAAFERRSAVAEAHPVDARDAAGVEVVLEVALSLGIRADDRDSVGRLGVRDLPALDEELLSRHPLERDPARPAAGRNVHEPCL